MISTLYTAAVAGLSFLSAFSGSIAADNVLTFLIWVVFALNFVCVVIIISDRELLKGMTVQPKWKVRLSLSIDVVLLACFSSHGRFLLATVVLITALLEALTREAILSAKKS